MKRNIERYFLFLFIFIFAISLVNVTGTFALGKKDDILSSAKKLIPKGVDTEACKKKDATKTGIDRYSAICKTQCTSTDQKYAQFKKDNKEACEFLATAGGGTNDTSTGGTDDAKIPSLTQAEINEINEINKIIPVDLSTKEAFDKIKEVFDVTVARLTHTDLNPVGGDAIFNDDNELTKTISFLGLVPVRVTIKPKAVAKDATKLALLEKLKKVFNQRIIALADKAPTTLGKNVDATKAPAPGSLYELIYNQATSNLDYLANIITKQEGTSIGLLVPLPNYAGIVNAKVIAVRKGFGPDTAIDILLQLDSLEEDYISGFEKLFGVTFSHAHIADLAATGAAFVAQKNFKEGLVPSTEASTPCPAAPGTFFSILTNHPACRNLLKITVPTDTTAEFGIRDGNTDAVGTPADHVNAARRAANLDVRETIGLILIFGSLLDVLAIYFNPSLVPGEDHYLYASDAIRNQLKSSKYVKDFDSEDFLIHNWPASEYVQAALAILPQQRKVVIWHTVSLLRADGDPRSIYLTKKIGDD